MANIDPVGANPSPPYRALVTIPQSDLTFVAGTLYTHDTDAFWSELKAWEASEEGIVFPDIQQRAPAQTIAGTTLAPVVRMLADVQYEDTGTFYSVRLEGTNNDLWDEEGGIFRPHGNVGVIPTNSAGLVVAAGSGLTPDESLQLERAADGSFGQKTLTRSLDPTNGVPGYLTLYDDENPPNVIGHKEIYETLDKTIGWRGGPIEFEGPLVAGPPP